jgi:hypothetical protein
VLLLFQATRMVSSLLIKEDFLARLLGLLPGCLDLPTPGHRANSLEEGSKRPQMTSGLSRELTYRLVLLYYPVLYCTALFLVVLHCTE